MMFFMNTFIMQVLIQFIKSDRTKGFYLKRISQLPKKNIKLFSSLIIISCEAEDWRNDAENSPLHHRNKFKLKI